MYLRRFYVVVFLFAATILTGCTGSEIKEEDLTEFNKMQWMLGVWEGSQGEADTYESWRRKNYRIMEGVSFTTLDGKRVYSQGMRIEQSNNNIFLIIKYDNGTEELNFRLKEISGNKAVFQNTEEGKYPEIIKYIKDGKKMQVLAEGESPVEPATELAFMKTSDY